MINLQHTTNINALCDEVLNDNYFIVELPDIKFVMALANEEFYSTVEQRKQLEFKLNQLVNKA